MYNLSTGVWQRRGNWDQLTLPADIRVLPQHEKASPPMLKSMVVCRYLQSSLTVAMKWRVIYSKSRQPSLPVEWQKSKNLDEKPNMKGAMLRSKCCGVTFSDPEGSPTLTTEPHELDRQRFVLVTDGDNNSVFPG